MMSLMPKKSITLEDLAAMMHHEFLVIKGQFVEMRKYMDARFEAIDRRFDRIENIKLRDHENRIERLEDRVQVIEKKQNN